MRVGPGQCLFAFLDRTEVFLDHRTDCVDIEVTADCKHCTCSIIEQHSIIFFDGRETSLGWGILVENDYTRVLAEQQVGKCASELIVRLLHIVRKDSFQLLETLAEVLSIETRVGELEVNKLKSSLEILCSRTSCDTVTECRNER